MLSGILNKPSLIFYTLCQRKTNSPYVVHISNKEDQYKTTLVSLLHKRDTQKIGIILENHKKIKGVYPENTFDSNTLFNLNITEDIPIKPLHEWFVKSWNQEDLMMYCVENWIDLMVIENLQDRGSIQVLEFELPHEYAIERLNKSLL